jgi:hypothetical protein
MFDVFISKFTAFLRLLGAAPAINFLRGLCFLHVFLSTDDVRNGPMAIPRRTSSSRGRAARTITQALLRLAAQNFFANGEYKLD